MKAKDNSHMAVMVLFYYSIKITVTKVAYFQRPVNMHHVRILN